MNYLKVFVAFNIYCLLNEKCTFFERGDAERPYKERKNHYKLKRIVIMVKNRRRIKGKWMRSIAEWLQHLTVNAKVATVLGSLPASSDTMESVGRQM